MGNSLKDNNIEDKTLAYYAMDLLDKDESIAIAEKIKNDPEIKLRFENIETGLGDSKEHPADMNLIWEKINKKINNRTNRNRNTIKTIKPPKKRYYIPITAAAGITAVLFGLYFMMPVKNTWEISKTKNTVNKQAYSKILTSGKLLTLSDKNAITIKHKTLGTVSITGPSGIKLAVFKPGLKSTTVWHLKKGNFRFKINKVNFKKYMVISPHAGITVTGTDFTVFVTKRRTSITVIEGQIKTQNNKTKQQKILITGHTAFINENTILLKKTIKQNIQQDPSFREKIFLNDGTVFSGKIISQTKKVILIKTKHGTFKINRNKIKNVSYH